MAFIMGHCMRSEILVEINVTRSSSTLLTQCTEPQQVLDKNITSALN